MSLRLWLAFAFLAFAVTADGFTPRTGHWNNLNESGSGYNIDIQNGILVITVYSYQTSGASQWYIASGPMTNGQHNFSGTLSKFVGGQCISCGYSGLPSSAGDDGSISINFTSETTAIFTLPGGRTTTIYPFDFGFGDPPQGLLGEWVYVEIIGGVYFADHYVFTQMLGATSNGTGAVADTSRNAVCELQISGVLGGMVACIHWSSPSLTTVIDQYVYAWGLDQTFGGLWVSPTSGNQYTMKGHLWAGSKGFPTAILSRSAMADATAQGTQKLIADQQASTVNQASEASNALAIFAENARALLAASKP